MRKCLAMLSCICNHHSFVYTLLGLLPQISLYTKLLVNCKGFIKSILIPIHFKFPLSFAVAI